MSVDCEAFIGYSITLKKDLSHDDFRFFNDFTEKYPQYDYYNHSLKRENRVILITDGMNGLYSRLVYVEKHIDECWMTEKYYFPLKSDTVPKDVFIKLNEAYGLMYGKDVSKDLIEYALFFHAT